MARKHKSRLTLGLTDKMYEDIERDANLYGISMSSYCVFIVGQYYATKEKMIENTTDKLNDLMNGMGNDLKKW